MTIGVKAFTCEGKKGEKHNFAGDIVDIAPSLQLGRPTILLRWPDLTVLLPLVWNRYLEVLLEYEVSEPEYGFWALDSLLVFDYKNKIIQFYV